MSNTYIFLICLGMGIVTYIPRVLPLILFSDREMPDGLKEALKFVPVAMLSALIAKDVFFRDDTLFLSLSNPKLLAFLIVIFVAAKFKSIMASLVVGTAAVFIFSLIL
ncbi:AzlD domain-containing protein [Peptacetobacter hominis]|uniref:AzlD domain-containing protein n=1 Tax=Peptacetobacter hominis TaxID=2743610 RepID=A0A544QXQ8_9FIRM|nr:AzlD domain-containing protein [Peptacetobacter hominis]TQQ85527.1 AzlD domain-containing protein [Peptacetobacter hominis]